MVCFRLRHQTTHSCHWLQPLVDVEIFERRIYSAFWEGEPLGEPNFFGRVGARPYKKIHRLKSALSFFVINYGLKSVAWFAFGCVIRPHIHATGFSQWLMTKFLSAEFIRRFGAINWRVVLQHDRKLRRQRKSAALQNYSLFATRHSLPFSARQEPHLPKF